MTESNGEALKSGEDALKGDCALSATGRLNNMS